jgi:hypothetical protein
MLDAPVRRRLIALFIHAPCCPAGVAEVELAEQRPASVISAARPDATSPQLPGGS